MSDVTDADILIRLACVHGHLKATIQMVERGEQDLAIAHQLHAVRGALLKVQVQLLRAQIERWADPSIDIRTIKSEVEEIVKTRKRKP